MTRVIAITGLARNAKTALTIQLADALMKSGAGLGLVDNSDTPLRFDGLTVNTVRLLGGCVCCTLARSLPDAIEQVATEDGVVLMPVSVLADPQALADVLDGLRQPTVSVKILAVMDRVVRQRLPDYAKRVSEQADLVVDESYRLDDVLRAVL